MKKILILMILFLMAMPVFAMGEPLSLDKNIYAVGDAITLSGEGIQASSVQIIVTSADGSGLYNIEQIPVFNGRMLYTFYLPDAAELGDYKITTSINKTLTFKYVKKIENDVPELTLDVEAFGVMTTRSFLLTGTLEELGDVTVTLDGEAVELIQKAKGKFTFSKQMSYDSDGKKGIVVKAVDASGNRIAFTRWFYVDSTPAKIVVKNNNEVVKFDAYTYLPFGTATVDLDVNISDNFPELNVKVNDNALYYKGYDYVSYVAELKPIEYVYSTKLVLKPGLNKYYVSVTDAAGTVTMNPYKFYVLNENGDKPEENNGNQSGNNTGTSTPQINLPTQNGSVPANNVVTFKLNQTDVELEVGSGAVEKTFDLDVSDNTGTIFWVSSDTRVATVDANGIITAVGVGKATITASKETGNDHATAVVNVFLVGEEVTPLGAVTFNLPYMVGFEDGTFRPASTITRAQMAVIYTKILGLKTDDTFMAKFTDVNEKNWSFIYVQAAAKAGIFSGYEDGSFKPNQALSRGELAATFSKFWALKNIEVKSDAITSVSDVSSHWAKNHIYKLYHAKVIQSDVSKFEPNEKATRAQVVLMVNALLGRQPMDIDTSVFKDVTDKELIGAIQAATQE